MDSVSQSINPLRTSITNAKTFLSDNLAKKPLHAATLFGISSQTLYTLIARNKKPVFEKQRGENNKILVRAPSESFSLFCSFLTCVQYLAYTRSGI